MATDANKLKKLCEIEGMSEDEILNSATFDSECYGICINDGCDYTCECEPDAYNNYCESCGTKTVKSCLVLAGMI